MTFGAATSPTWASPAPISGAGGKYLLLPPGYTGAVPDGYFVVHSRTYGNSILFRGFIVNGDLRPAVENTKQHFRVYPLDRAANPPAMNFVNISGQYFNTIPATDASYFEQVASVVQEEPLDHIDPETRGLLAAIGIRKDKPFAPDARMKAHPRRCRCRRQRDRTCPRLQLARPGCLLLSEQRVEDGMDRQRSRILARRGA